MRVEFIDSMGDDESVVKAARVSFASDDYSERTEDQNNKLIKYLADHNHWTPFAHVMVTLRMTAPIPIRTQCFKHKQGFTENEESRRYISTTPEFYVPMFRESVKYKKQGSGDLITGYAQMDLQEGYIDHMEGAISYYESLLKSGVAEEQARFVLPQGVEVSWYWTGSLAAYARFCKQRMDPHAQLEIQELAHEVSNIISKVAPVSWGALIGE